MIFQFGVSIAVALEEGSDAPRSIRPGRGPAGGRTGKRTTGPLARERERERKKERERRHLDSAVCIISPQFEVMILV